MTALKNFVPPKEEHALCQAKIKKHIWEEANKYREQNGWTWPEFLEALFTRELEEAKKK